MGGNSFNPGDVQDKGPRLIFSQRFITSYAFFFGTFCFYIMRANMSVAIVCMTTDNDTTDNNVTDIDDGCPIKNNSGSSSNNQGEFDWDRSLRGFILSSFYIGYFLTQFPAGWLGKRLGCKRLIMIGILILSFATFITPVSARASVYLLIFIQIVKGAASGLLYPCLYQLWGFWAPPSDRSALVAISLSGASLGSVFSSIVSGQLCAHGFAGGWPSIFYVFGVIAVVWSVAWMFLGYDTPAKHPRISPEEREYIEKSLGQQKEDTTISVPWVKLFTCMPFYAILVTDVMYSWVWFTALNVLPQYMNDVLKFNIKQNGFYNALPYLANFFITMSASFMADWIIGRELLSRTWTRKLLTSLGLFPAGVIAIVIGFLTCHQVPLAITLLTFWVGLLGCTRSGSIVNAIDLAPAYAGVMTGIEQTLITIPGMVAPTVTGIMTTNGTPEEWRNVFFMASAIALFGWIFYMIFGDAMALEWAKLPEEFSHIDRTDSVKKEEMTDVNSGGENGQANEGYIQ